MTANEDSDRGLILAIARLLRRAICGLQTSKASVTPLEKVVRAAMLVPLYTLFSIPLMVSLPGRRYISAVGLTHFGAQMNCRLPDLIQTYVWVFKEWEPDLTRFIADRLGEGDVFVDVGANVGYYSLLAAECVGADGEVVAVEASPSVCAEFQRNVERNNVSSRVRLENKAASAQAGTLTVYSGPARNTGMTSTVPSRGADTPECEVEARPLDDILSSKDCSKIRLIKIDVEGAEPHVIAGMTRLIPQLAPETEIILELSPKWWEDPALKPSEVLRPFTDAGFNIYEMRNSYSAWRYLWPNDVSDAIRVNRELEHRTKQLDLVLSRTDAERLVITPDRFIKRFWS